MITSFINTKMYCRVRIYRGLLQLNVNGLILYQEVKRRTNKFSIYTVDLSCYVRFRVIYIPLYTPFVLLKWISLITLLLSLGRNMKYFYCV